MDKNIFEVHTNVTLDAVASHIQIPSTGELPTIILAIAPCRSGTTVQLRMFGAVGIAAYYQPLKATLRRLRHSMESIFRIPNGTYIFLKETLGPYTDNESRFDPVDVLLRAGYPAEKICLIAEMRAPLSTLTSWQEQFSYNQDKDILFKNFITAYETVINIYNYSRDAGIDTNAYVYEAQRDYLSTLAVERLFNRLNIPYSDQSAGGWSNLPAFGSPESNVYLPIEPAFYRREDVYVAASNATELRYIAKTLSSIDKHVTINQIQRMLDLHIPSLYEYLCAETSQQLCLQIRYFDEISSYLSRNSEK